MNVCMCMELVSEYKKYYVCVCVCTCSLLLSKPNFKDPYFLAQVVYKVLGLIDLQTDYKLVVRP